MVVDSSLPDNASLPSPPFSSATVSDHILSCLKARVVIFNMTAFTITIILTILPLCIFIVYLGFQQWRQRRGSTTVSLSDLFTYHMVIAELMDVFGSTLLCCGVYTCIPQVSTVGVYLSVGTFTGQIIFHILTCVERYLAVVHPIAYLSLKKVKVIRIRNFTFGCVWMLCITLSCLVYTEDNLLIVIIFFSFIPFSLIIVSFCSLSVLCVLLRSGPEGKGVARQRLDQSKLRAFHTIVAILGVLLVKFVGNMLTRGLYSSPNLGETERCAVWLSFVWFGLPSSLVLPLLFLQRARKLLCCKKNNESRQQSD